jgi:hypothetical protein
MIASKRFDRGEFVDGRAILGYSGEGERSFRWQAERHSGDDEQQSERSDADLVIVEQSVQNRQARLSGAKRKSFGGDLGAGERGGQPLYPLLISVEARLIFS